ncbi:MAG: TIGR00730 family Rossman fold protein [Bacteroidales bacterium]|nr:TIGR00730 family Rossman fold protein [Bacteroidales bacterium]
MTTALQSAAIAHVTAPRGHVCVYAASSGQVSQHYVQAAYELGSLLVAAGYGLVNGAGRTGLMAATTDGVLATGGHAVGIIPQFMIEHGWGRTDMSHTIVTPDMHSRKQTMANLSVGCIALPGGVGTLEELLEIITWKQLGLFDRPIVILNSEGFYDPLLAMLHRLVDEQMMRPMHTNLWCVAATPQEAVALLASTPTWDITQSKFAAM